MIIETKQLIPNGVLENKIRAFKYDGRDIEITFEDNEFAKCDFSVSSNTHYYNLEDWIFLKLLAETILELSEIHRRIKEGK